MKEAIGYVIPVAFVISFDLERGLLRTTEDENGKFG
jgi:hypothetical protein